MKIRVVQDSNIESDAFRAVHDQMVNITQGIFEDAQRAVPVDTGNLKESASWSVDATTGTGVVGYEADYAEYVSDGTSEQKANPWFKSAVFKPRSGN